MMMEGDVICTFNSNAYEAIEVDGITYERNRYSVLRQPFLTFKEDKIWNDWDNDLAETFRWHPTMEKLRF